MSNKQKYLDINKNIAPPEKPWQKIIARAYPITLAFLTLATVIAGRRQKIDWRKFAIYICIGAIFGWSWNYWIVSIDPKISGWMFHIWAYLGIDFGAMILEDFLFYIICGAFFFFIRQRIPKTHWNTDLLKYIVLGVIIAGSVGLFQIFYPGGKSIIVWFGIPTVLALCFTWNKWDVGRFLAMTSFVTVFAAIWDVIAVTICPAVLGDWASHWIYKFPDGSHSFVWHPKLWIWNSPVEITPFFGIYGGMFIYSLAQLTYDR